MATSPNAHRFLQPHPLEKKPKPEQVPLVEAALLFWAYVGHLALVRRILASFLPPCGVKFPQQPRAAFLSSTDRNLRQLKQQAPAALARHLPFRPAQKVGPAARVPPEHSGPLVEFLVARARTTLAEVQGLLQDQWGIRVSRSTVENTLQRYGLSRLLRPKAQVGRPAPQVF